MITTGLYMLREEGFFINPSTFFKGVAFDLETLLIYLPSVEDISVIRSLADRVIEQRQYGQIPLLCDRIHKVVLRLGIVALTGGAFWSLSEPFRNWVMKKEVVLDVQQARQKLQDFNQKNRQLQSQLGGDNFEKVRQEVAGFCRDFVAYSKSLENVRSSAESDPIIQQFKDLNGVIKEELLKRVAQEIDPEDEDDYLGHSAYMHLYGIGWRNADLNEICKKLGCKENDGVFLPLKLAEKGIFSRKCLQELLKDCKTQEEQIALLTKTLKDPALPQAETWPMWQQIKVIAIEMDRVVASVSAVALHILAFAPVLVQFQCITNLKDVFWFTGLIGLSLMDGVYYASHVRPIHFSRSDFVEGDWKDRAWWIVQNSDPAFNLSYLIAKEWGKRSFREIPSVLYNAYLA